MKLYHGSDHIVKNPSLLAGKPYNDYGRGFYTTTDYELAGEWACRQKTDGFINEYELDIRNLEILDLQSDEFSVLNWISMLLKNRTFEATGDVALEAREFLLKNYLPDTKEFDVIVGYRADDSCFSYAESFINNGLSLRKLEQAMKLGELGIQHALVSKKAFEALKYVDSYRVESKIYYESYKKRDEKARTYYKENLRRESASPEDIFITDIMRRSKK